MVAGSAWSGQANTTIGIEVSLDGKPIGSSSIFSNNPSVHRATVPTYLPVKLTIGSHTLTLSASTTTTVTDLNDPFEAALFY
jgi:hypothetical protein